MNDLTGNKFNRLTVIKLVGKQGRSYMYLCKCDCGAEKVLRGANVSAGHTKSCGCLHREKNLRLSHARRRNWSPTYQSWTAMRRRVTNPNHQSYKNYGGRGISITESWRTFENFLFDMGPRPGGTTLDRINNNGNYEPGNCRWANVSQQNYNKRNNVVNRELIAA
jgi:hypothetical protein